MLFGPDSDTNVRLTGYWWLPGAHTSERVPGVLTFSPDSGGQLELIGGFSSHSPDGVVSYPRVLGEVEHRYVTLFECWTRSRRQRGGSAAPREVVGVGRGIIGILFDDPDEHIEFDRCRVRMRHLTQWSGLNGLSLDDDYWTGPGDSERLRATARAEWIEETDCILENGWGLELSQYLQPVQEMNLYVGIRQEIVLTLKAPALASAEQFIDQISDFQDLLTIGAGRPGQITDLLFEHPNAPVQFVSGETHPTAREELKYLARWNAVDTDQSLLNWAILFFSLEDFGGVEGVSKWMAIASNYRTELGRVMGVRYRTSMSFSDRIINLTAAIESFDNRRAPSKIKDLRIRLKRLVKLCDPTFSPGMIDEDHLEGWYQAVIVHRDNAAHHRGRPVTQTSAQQHYIGESLHWLFVLSMLKLCGAPDAALARVLRHNDIYWLRQGLATAFGPIDDNPNRPHPDS